MNSGQHLFFNFVILVVVSLIAYSLGFNVLNLNWLQFLIAFYVFSNLPDIDNRSSKITKTFYLIYLFILVYGIIQSKYAFVMLAIVLSMVHFFIARNDSKHRSFPHRLPFGIVASLILWYYTSLPIAIIGLLCFSLHVFADRYNLKKWIEMF